MKHVIRGVFVTALLAAVAGCASLGYEGPPLYATRTATSTRPRYRPAGGCGKDFRAIPVLRTSSLVSLERWDREAQQDHPGRRDRRDRLVWLASKGPRDQRDHRGPQDRRASTDRAAR
jgi:hypothetical protein